jgi:signal peptidase I
MEKEVMWDIAETLIRNGEHVKIKLTGFSMYPQLRPNDYAIIGHKDFSAIIPGNIVAFKYNKTYVLHRVMKFENDHLICKGDARMKNDAPVDKSAIIGVLLRAERNGEIVYDHEFFNTSISSKIMKYPFFYTFKALIIFRLKKLFCRMPR